MPIFWCCIFLTSAWVLGNPINGYFVKFDSMLMLFGLFSIGFGVRESIFGVQFEILCASTCFLEQVLETDCKPVLFEFAPKHGLRVIFGLKKQCKF